MKRFIALIILTAMLFSLTAVCASAEDIKRELPGTEEESGFVHSGILQSGSELDRIAKAIQNGEEPYKSAFEELKKSQFAQAGAGNRAVETVIRGGQGDNCSRCYQDIQRAFQCAIVWRLSGDTACGDTARDILNAWSSTLKSVSGNADRYLGAGLYGYQMANAAEIMRDYPGFEKEQMQDMLLNVFYKPMNERFLFSNEYGKDHNDAYIENYWANWDLCNMAAGTAIAIFCDRRDIYDKMVGYFKYGAGNGSIYNAVPRLYKEGLAQQQESGRDQGHCQLGIGLMASICEMAWNQNEDLYGWANNRFMYAAEYVARYNNGDEVPFTEYQWGTGRDGILQSHGVVSNAGRGEYRAIWEMIYNHYAKRKGLNVPNIERRAQLMRPEGGPGGHATTFDQPGFGTLLYTRDLDVQSVSDSETNIKNGVYKIKSRLSDKLLTVKDNRLYQYQDGEKDQEFTVTHIGGGEYAITIGDKGLTVKECSYDNGAEIGLEKYEGNINQRFAFIDLGGGYYRIIAAHSSKPLDVSGASKDDGAQVNQYRKVPGGQNQEWSLELMAEEESAAMRVVVNGKVLELDVEPVVLEGRTLIPMRALFEALGKEVTWNDSLKKASAGTEIEFFVGSRNAKVNGEEKTMDVAAMIVDGRTMVPLRFVAENLSYDVKYDNLNRTAVINSVLGQ